MWHILFFVLLLCLPVSFANVSNNKNDCDSSIWKTDAIHACQDGSFSGQKVAMDASMFSGSFCECTLTSSRNTNKDCVAITDVYYANNTNTIQFSVNNTIYTNTSTGNEHNFDGAPIQVVVEKTHTGNGELKTGNPCMMFRVPGCNLTLSCFNGTDKDPRKSDVSNKENYCPRPFEEITIHACQNSSLAGTQVAMDASRFSGSYCECKLTTSREASRGCVVFVDFMYDKPSNIKISVDNVAYTKALRDKQFNFYGDFIRVVVERTHKGDAKPKTGNLCMRFRGQAPNRYACSITLSCSSGTDMDPRKTDFTTQSKKLTESVSNELGDFTTQSSKQKESVPKEIGGTHTVIIIIIVVVVSAVCTTIINVLITRYCKRRNRFAMKSDEITITTRKESVSVEINKTAVHVPMELLNQPSNTQGSTDQVYEQPDINTIAIRAHENKTEPLFQEPEASVYENEVKETVEQPDGDGAYINVVANIAKHPRENQDHVPILPTEQLYTQLDTTSASIEHMYDVSG